MSATSDAPPMPGSGAPVSSGARPPGAAGNGGPATGGRSGPRSLAESARDQPDLGERIKPESGEETATLDDFAVTRDPETDAIEPLKAKTPYHGLVVRVRPLTYRDQRKYGLEDRGLLLLEHDERLEFLREHVVEPDLSEIDDLEDLRYGVVEDVLLTIAALSRDRRWAMMPEPVEDGAGDGGSGKA